MSFPFNPENYMREGTFVLTPDEFTKINSSLSREEFIDFICKGISLSPLPLRSISFLEATQDFKSLQNFRSSSLLKKGKWTSRYDYKWKCIDGYIDQHQVGSRSANYFHQESRWLADSINSPSPYRNWTIPRFQKTLCNAIFSLGSAELNPTEFRKLISLRKYICSQFRPSSAKALYDLFEPVSVLDPCSGWGDRLAGAFSSNTVLNYTGIDPNSRLIQGYANQVNTYHSFSPRKAQMISQCAEDVELVDFYDLVFTSPPYFDVERYNSESTQSWKKYKKLQDWKEKFLFVMISKAWHSLKDEGILILNISDVYSHHKRQEFCDDMNDYISTLDDSHYCGAIGYRMSKRMNSGYIGESKIFGEPIWIWSKNKSLDLLSLFPPMPVQLNLF